MPQGYEGRGPGHPALALKLRAGHPAGARPRRSLCDLFEGSRAHAVIYSAFVDAGVRDVSVHPGIMDFDGSSGVLSSRSLHFHADLPAVVEAVGRREDVEAALLEVRCVLARGLITLTDVQIYEPG